MAFDFSPSASLVAVQVLLDQAHDIFGAGDLAASDRDALNAYRRASGIAENAALSFENITIVLAQADPSLAAYPAATRSLSASATASVNEAGQTSDRGIARQASNAAIRAAEDNRDLAKEATAAGKANESSRVTLGTVGWVLALGALAGGVWWATTRAKNPIGNSGVRVRFKTRSAQIAFKREWIARTGGPPIDKIVNGIEYVSDDAERAEDIALSLDGVIVESLAQVQGFTSGQRWIESEGAADCTDKEVKDMARDRAYFFTDPLDQRDYERGFLLGVKSMCVR